VYVADLERTALVKLLHADDGRYSAITADLLRSGAEFNVYEAEPHPPDRLAAIYRRSTQRRLKHELDARESEDLVNRFERSEALGSLVVVLGESHEYHVIMSAQDTRVVAIIQLDSTPYLPIDARINTPERA
jgi:hypothetical protein